MKIFSSNRSFVVFSYSISHGLLLLRSRKTNEHPTRIDILFQDVRAMEIRMWFESIEIREGSPQLLEGFASKPSEMLESGNKIYQIIGAGWYGYILAGIVQTCEDQGEFFASSALMK